MIEIKVILFGKYRWFHWQQHIAAIVTDLDTHRHFSLDYTYQDYTIYNEEKLSPLKHHIKTIANNIETVELKINKNFDELYKHYRKTFPPGEYDFFMSNCADAVLFALEECHPRPFCEKFFLNLYRFLCVGFFIGLLGLKYIPAPPLLNTPYDVFLRAKEIKHQQSHDLEVKTLSPSFAI